MRAKELAEILLQHPDADVVITFQETSVFIIDEDTETFSCTISAVDKSWLPQVISIEGNIVISA